MRLACGHVCGELSWWLIDGGGSRALWAVPALEMWSQFEKNASRAWTRERKAAVSGVPLWFLLQVPALIFFNDGLWPGSVRQINPSLLKLFLVRVFIKATENHLEQWERFKGEPQWVSSSFPSSFCSQKSYLILSLRVLWRVHIHFLTPQKTTLKQKHCYF